MKTYKVVVSRPRFQPGFEPESPEVEEVIQSRKWRFTPYLYLFMGAAATIFWMVVMYVILP